MSLLKQLLEEFDGGTGAGDVAGAGGAYGSLFAGGVLPQGKKKKANVIRRVTLLKPEFQQKLPKSKGWYKLESKYPTLKETLSIASEESDFDASDVLSKIDDAKRKVDNNNNCAVFGLEDSDGNIVKVYVNKDQAKEFEEELSTMLYNDKHVNMDDDESNSSVEIAELLWKVKDKYEIVDIEWGALPEDEEEQQTVSGEEGKGQELGGEEGQPADGEELPAGDEELGAEEEMMPDAGAGGEDESVKSALQQVIDMLRADAEAKMAEAKARSDEAKAKQAEFAARAAESKIRQEEQTLEMEDYYNSKKEEDNEVKKLVKLAKYKHDKAKEYGSMVQNNAVPEEDEEEQEDLTNEISTDELAKLLISRLQHN